MERPLDFRVIDICATRQRRKKIILILVTEGGDADPAYRVARCLQDYYTYFSLFVSGYCKSAGTLVALGAHELIFSDKGELGPLDVQMSKEDELGATRSGLTVLSALSTMQIKAYEAFEYFLLETKKRSAGFITTRTAIRVATDLAGSLFAPIYEHVDSMHIGEAGRSLKIAHKYGEILCKRSQNCQRNALDQLTTNYPSHGFIIDRLQAENLFNNVREPSVEETNLAILLGAAACDPLPQAGLLSFLNSDKNTSSETNDDLEQNHQLGNGSKNRPEVDSGTNDVKVEPTPTA